MLIRPALVHGLFSQPQKNFLLFLRCFSSLRQTIFAMSSGQGKCGVAVVRVSGPEARNALEAIAGSKCHLNPRSAQLKVLRDPQSKEILDRAVVIWFPGPRSFTGEDSCEFQVHGGVAVVSSVLAALGKIPGLRAADPGEFSKRAFYNGKMDLTEAEGLADLIHAETEMQRKQALIQMSGSLHELYQSWRKTLLKCVAHVEAFIDFSEDENIEDGVMESVETSVKKLCDAIQAHLADGRRGERLRDGVTAAIIGEPNVGKSTLLNTLCCRPAAIVTPLAGTTRDIVQQYINIGGYPLSLGDTAGLRGKSETCDLVEEEGIARALSFAHTADLILLVVDSCNFLKWLDGQRENMSDLFNMFLTQHIEKLGLQLSQFQNPLAQHSHSSSESQYFIVLSKADLITDENLKNALLDFSQHQFNVTLVSCTSQEGLSSFISKLQHLLQILCGNPSHENPTITQVRHRQHLCNCLHHLQNYLNKIKNLTNGLQSENVPTSPDLALSAEELRRALYCLGKITGHITTEQVLDVIFRDFCIGK